jgi:hypothetical protein
MAVYPSYRLVKYLGGGSDYWRLGFERDAKLWLQIPDGEVVYVPDITRELANRLMHKAQQGGDILAMKSGDIYGNPDVFYEFNDWCMRLRFSKSGELEHSEVCGKCSNGAVLPDGIHVGAAREGPFHTLVGTDLERLD